MSLRYLAVFLLAFCLHGAWGCRFRANAVNPYPADAGATGGSSDMPMNSGGTAVDTGGSQGNDSGSGGKPTSSSTGGSSTEDASVADASPPTKLDAGILCTPPTPAVCNPVTNVGCENNPGTQCAIDTLALTLAGYCILSAPSDAGACVNTGLSESCPPGATCINGECHKLCFCDNECGDGQCCFEFIGNLGFKACKTC